MRTFLTSFTAVVLALSFLSSCGTDAKDIDVTKLETACDFADALLSVGEDMGEVKDNKPTPEQKELQKKAREITKAMDTKTEASDDASKFVADFAACPSTKALLELEEKAPADGAKK
jgi:hypothetical protein